jgi:hypothetical protein
MANKNKYKEIFSDIYVSEGLERNILNMTGKKRLESKPMLKLVYIFSIVFLMCVFSLSVVYAKEIKETIDKWASFIFMGDGTKVPIGENNDGIKLPENVTKEGKDEMTLKEAEKMLDINLLSSPLFTSDSVNYLPTVIGERIQAVNIWYPYCVSYSEEKSIAARFAFVTDKATDHVSISDQAIDAGGGKVLVKEYKSENLGVNVVIYGVDWSNSNLTATFVYKNIVYIFIGRNVSPQEMIDLIETLK